MTTHRQRLQIMKSLLTELQHQSARNTDPAQREYLQQEQARLISNINELETWIRGTERP